MFRIFSKNCAYLLCAPLGYLLFGQVHAEHARKYVYHLYIHDTIQLYAPYFLSIHILSIYFGKYRINKMHLFQNSIYARENNLKSHLYQRFQLNSIID